MMMMIERKEYIPCSFEFNESQSEKVKMNMHESLNRSQNSKEIENELIFN